jgi:hypothetical protein
MKLKSIAPLCALALACVISGCVNTIDGRQQVGLPMVKDKIQSSYERSPMEIWKAAKDVLAFQGKLYSEDVMRSTLEASVNTRTVWVRVDPVDQKSTRVTVQARTKGGGSDIELASEIDKQIAIRLATGNLTPAAPANSTNASQRGT